MRSLKSWRPLSSLVRGIPGTLLVGFVTLACYALGLNPTATGFLYLIVVLIQSLIGDFISACAVAVIANLCLNFFFVPPIFSLRVSDSSDIWALISFLITAPVITRLTTRVREEAFISERRRREMKLLYELAQCLLTLDPRHEILQETVSLFRRVFDLDGVCIYDGVNSELRCEGNSQIDLSEKTRTAYISLRGNDDTASAIFIRPLLAEGKVIGAVGFAGLKDGDVTADPLTALAATVVERAHVFFAASQSTAATQVEVFRGAILDALAHEFKTPLAVIVTAASALGETGELTLEQQELAELAESEASRLARLTSRLLRVARLDREEVKPELEIIGISALVENLKQQYSRRWTDRQFSVKELVPGVQISGDRELVQLALGQLLDNAAKYSRPGSLIEISVEPAEGFVRIRVWNNGSLIPEAERQKIFERFYRGSETLLQAPGSGLGLYVARKIAVCPWRQSGTGIRGENGLQWYGIPSHSAIRYERIPDSADRAPLNPFVSH